MYIVKKNSSLIVALFDTAINYNTFDTSNGHCLKYIVQRICIVPIFSHICDKLYQYHCRDNFKTKREVQ